MTTTLTLDVKLCGGRTSGASWAALIEVTGSFTLSELHSTIQRLVDFDDDHLHEFFVGRNWRDRKITFGEPDGDGSEEEVQLSSIVPLPKNQKLYYNFDFGDNWLFEIACLPQKKPADRTLKGATLIQEKGHKPIQYPGDDDEG